MHDRDVSPEIMLESCNLKRVTREKYNRVKPLCPQESALKKAEEKDRVVENEHVR